MTIAVIGLGSIGMRHAENLIRLGESVCGFDPDPARRELLAKAGGRATDKRDDSLKAAEAVIICSPNIHHLSDLENAIDKGCHVLMEKPLSHTLTGVSELIDTAVAKRKTIAVAMNLRFHPVVKEVKNLLKKSAAGKVIWGRFLCASYLPGWRPHQDYRKGYTTDPVSGGVLFDVIHETDLACHLLGPATVAASVARTSGTIETSADDCADLILRHPEQVYSNLHLDYVSKNAQRYFEIQGTAGLIKGDLLSRRLTVIDAGGKTATEHAFPGSFADDYIEEMQNFLAAIRGKNGYICTATEAFDSLKTVIEARKIAGLEVA